MGRCMQGWHLRKASQKVGTGALGCVEAGLDQFTPEALCQLHHVLSLAHEAPQVLEGLLHGPVHARLQPLPFCCPRALRLGMATTGTLREVCRGFAFLYQALWGPAEHIWAAM